MDIVLLMENLVRSDDMASLKCVGSGSSGNCYILTCNNEKLILDCGLPIKVIKQGLDFDLQGIQGILVGHQHLDHSLSANDFKKMGFEVWMPYLDEIKTRKRQFGNFNVSCFDLTDLQGNWMHTNADGTECPCYGFLIEHSELGRMLYITDTELIKWKFRDINHILLGVNYDKDLLDNENQSKRNHVYRGHLSIDTACEFVKCNSDSLETVIMCHLSDSNSDVDSFISKMKNVAPVANIFVAERGLEVELREKGECPF